MSLLSLTDYVTKEMLQEIADRFYDTTNMVVGFSDYQGNLFTRIDHFSTPICNYYRAAPGFENCCITCDAVAGMNASIRRAPYTHICHSGLCYCALPIYLESTYLGMALIGEVRVSEEEMKQLPSMLNPSHKLYPTPEAYQKAYENIRLVTLNELETHVKLLQMLLDYIIEVGNKKIMQEKFNKQQEELMKKREVEVELQAAATEFNIKTFSDHLQPEFLLEIINSIYQQATIEEANETAEMVYSVAKFLKRRIHMTDVVITLEDELLYLEELIGIRNISRDEKIILTSSVEESYKNIQIPKNLISVLCEYIFLQDLDRPDILELHIGAEDTGESVGIHLYCEGFVLPDFLNKYGDKAEDPNPSKQMALRIRSVEKIIRPFCERGLKIETKNLKPGTDELIISLPKVLKMNEEPKF